MKLEDFKDLHRDKSPIEKLRLLVDAVEAVGRCRYGVGNAEYLAREREGQKDRANWLYSEIVKALDAQEPRVMTEQEMRDAEPGAVIYCEQRDEVRTYLTPLIKYDDGAFENRFLGANPEAMQLPNVRFWTSRPTDEQREAEPWE